MTPNQCYRLVLLFCRVVVCPYGSFFLGWLGGSFAKFGRRVDFFGFANFLFVRLAKVIFKNVCWKK
jgi:hypothetical protein